MVLVAVEGCCHGSLNKIYDSLKPDVELLLICGDFQAIRNFTDLETMNVPPKYKQAGDFPDYYSSERKAPVLTIFIGGNHECSSYMRELQYGGWVAPNIYYLGEFGSVWYKGLRITGISGIWNAHSFYSKRPFDYKLPYDLSSIRLVYHVKPKNLLKLLISKDSLVVMSHDWPQGIWKFGNERALLQKKKFFKDDMKSGKLGSPAARAALEKIVPDHWFSLHLHVKFTARFSKVVTEVVSISETKDVKSEGSDKPSTTKNGSNSAELISLNKDVISLDMDGDDEQSSLNGAIELDMDDDIPQQKEKRRKVTRVTEFLALDKCLPRRSFLDYVDIKPDENHPSFKEDALYYDAHGLAAQQVVENFVHSDSDLWRALDPQVIINLAYLTVKFVEELEASVEKKAKDYDKSDLKIFTEFKPVAPSMLTDAHPPPGYWPNPQTDYISTSFGIPLPDLNK